MQIHLVKHIIKYQELAFIIYLPKVEVIKELRGRRELVNSILR